MDFVDEMLKHKIITRADQKFIEDMLYDSSKYKKSLVKKHKQIVPSMFKAMDALSIEGIESLTFLYLKMEICEEYSKSKKVTSFDVFVELCLYMTQAWGFFRIESGILKTVPDDEQEQAAKDFEVSKILDEWVQQRMPFA